MLWCCFETGVNWGKGYLNISNTVVLVSTKSEADLILVLLGQLSPERSNSLGRLFSTYCLRCESRHFPFIATDEGSRHFLFICCISKPSVNHFCTRHWAWALRVEWNTGSITSLTQEAEDLQEALFLRDIQETITCKIREECLALCVSSHMALNLLSSPNRNSFRVGVMAQATECLLCKHESLSSRPQNPHKKASLSSVCV